MAAAEASTDSLVEQFNQVLSAGYENPLICQNVNPSCEEEASWFGTQHGCYECYLCDGHMKAFVQATNIIIARRGYVGCPKCDKLFRSLAEFATIRPI